MSGVLRQKTTVIWKPVPAIPKLRSLLQGAVGKQVRRSKNFGTT
jgi:hypothetical protein